jgi:hypothetical protein
MGRSNIYLSSNPNYTYELSKREPWDLIFPQHLQLLQTEKLYKESKIAKAGQAKLP